MNACIEFDLQAFGESEFAAEIPSRRPARYVVVGSVLDSTRRRLVNQDTIHETDDLLDARLVCDLERHCSGINGYDSAIIWDRYLGREIPFTSALKVPTRRRAA